ncbi:DUF924 domain-containing protein [Pseudomonas sp. PDM14]|uniref:DUF924 family protein n=1 Tax=Pseudomonas sp. PDM14 TaxID=2769288 RepID=UPI00178372CB|nr:DUF924 family protein [Pseudomonas sp. PDM14]MBD9482879.1 DUF924 domain-containing protein [Pseudomonas sp. PDM14]
MPAWAALLEWWLGADADTASATAIAARRNKLWFGYQADQDAEARERFGTLVEQALAGGLREWAETPQGWLALILLLDQLPRMIGRDTAQAYAGDAQAQQLVREGLAAQREQALSALQQVFIYLVLEHAEDAVSQAESVRSFRALHDAQPASEQPLFAGFIDYAVRHQQVIERFGRFPHRNAILGRTSTPAELRYLAEPGSGF